MHNKKSYIIVFIAIIFVVVTASLIAWNSICRNVNRGYSSWLEFQKENPIGQEYNGKENEIKCKVDDFKFVGHRILLRIGFIDLNSGKNNEAIFEVNTWNVNGINGLKF